jgi:hypothetical protein
MIARAHPAKRDALLVLRAAVLVLVLVLVLGAAAGAGGRN